MPMRLELGWGRVKLGEGASELLGARPAPGTAPAATAVAKLSHLAGRSPASAELAALLEDTASAAVAVLAAAGPRAGGKVAAGNGGQPADQRPGGGGAEVIYRKTLRLSLATMPYLRDHSFFWQPEDWPHEEDRFPVVPATTIVGLLMEAVEAAVPGVRAVRVSNAKFTRWTVGEPAQDIEISVKPSGPDQFSASFGLNARATIHTAQAYPADPPPVWHHDPATERPTPISAERYYSERYTFHGPGISGMTAVHAVGERHVRGLLRTPAVPGGLLDSSLVLVGNWLRVTQASRQISFPMKFGSIRLYGPHPSEGDMMECVSRITALEDRDLIFDIQLRRADTGEVWAVLENILHRRFDTPARSRLAEVFPGRNAASELQPGGWVALFDYWSDPASLLTIAQSILGTRGWPDFDQQPIAGRKRWLMSVLAVKDAARHHLWNGGADEVYPIEVRVSDVTGGRARVAEWPERHIPAFEASVAVAGQVAVAMARPAGPGSAPGGAGLGIAVAEIADQPDDAPPSGEQGVLDAACRAEPACGRELWLTRFRAAREAAAKAQGTGPDGATGGPTVTGVAPGAITVAVSGRTRQVSYREIANPEGLPARRYVVAWTPAPENTRLANTPRP
jgi:Polyketide synthase dehydratase